MRYLQARTAAPKCVREALREQLLSNRAQRRSFQTDNDITVSPREASENMVVTYYRSSASSKLENVLQKNSQAQIAFRNTFAGDE